MHTNRYGYYHWYASFKVCKPDKIPQWRFHCKWGRHGAFHTGFTFKCPSIKLFNAKMWVAIVADSDT